MTPADTLHAVVLRHGVTRLGVAVSGGGDSVALLVLAVQVLGAGAVAAVTVDHGLRPESAAEAAAVAALCARLGVAHAVRHWQAPAHGNIQAAARAGRSELIADWAQARGLTVVALGHTLDDQAETVLMALSRAAGVDGLSAMPELRQHDGIGWLRPFLGVTRSALRDVLRAQGLTWAEDPTNADPRYERVRMRQVLAGAGLDAAALAALAGRMQQVRAALDAQTDALCASLVHEDRGTYLIDPRAATLPVEARARLILRLIAPASPRRAALVRWMAAGSGTLAGWTLAPRDHGGRLYREGAAVAELRVPVGAVWDGRWQAVGPSDAVIAALGEAGLARLSAQAAAGLHPHWRDAGLPRAVLAGLPALWRGDTLVAAPLAGWANGCRIWARPLATGGAVTELSH